MTSARHAARQEREPAPGTAAAIGEDGILRRILPIFAALPVVHSPEGPRVVEGPGDDAAVYDLAGRLAVLSTDTQTQGEDHLLRWPCGHRTRGAELGWKSAAQNLADLAAMGADPLSLVISLSFPGTTAVDFLEDMARGYVAAIRALGAGACSVDGGDLGGAGELSATVAALGACRGMPVRRDGARPGDVVVLAGTVGRAAAGLDLLLHEDFDPADIPTEVDAAHARPGPRDADRRALADLAATQLRPCPPLGAGPVLAEAGARAMIDVSDGLVRDAGRLARASGVQVRLDSRALTGLREDLEPAGRLLGRDPMDWVLTGGEDHGLLACLPSQAPLPPGVRAIGSCRKNHSDDDHSDDPPVTLDGGVPEHLGWDHFGG